VDKRIDILSSFIQQGGTIYDLAEFEHAYAPPYSSAKDPVNMAGFVAENILSDRLKIFYWDELAGLKPEDLLIDVRNPNEFSAGSISGAINIPLDEIRERLEEIPADKDIYIFCEAGLRGYLAQRILKQRGIDSVSNLSGGYFLWKACIEESGK
jgi:rhodanese-related sulfurtransferase